MKTSSKNLFNEWCVMSEKIKDLRCIIQNDNQHVSRSDVIRFKCMCGDLMFEFTTLAGKIIGHLKETKNH